MKNRPRPTPGQLAQLACLFEVTARKPGNIHRFADFEDAHYLDYLLSAAALVRPLDRAPRAGIGRTVLRAVRATRRLVATNTNLGMVLLLVPLAAVPEEEDQRPGVERRLDAADREETRRVYRAIRLARPGGLGTVADQDVRAEPSVPLRAAMALAADRDLIARQYANGFAEVFGVGLRTLQERLDAGSGLEAAIVATHLTLLAHLPDTLIVRKRGPDVAAEASRRAAEVLASGWPDHRASGAFDELDAWLRGDGHARNPGATADLIAAVLFVALRDGTIPLPIASGPARWSAPA